MGPSPRKRVTRASFNQTWDDANAALFDPSSLPVARIPRGWERRQETKKTEAGREKKIWRRVNTRSRAQNTAEEEAEEAEGREEEEHDARSRAVKRRQHMSPKAMEKTTAKLNGKKRAFKGTRWDRRKSVLPRKQSTRTGQQLAADQIEDEESDTAQDATGGDLSYESLATMESVTDASIEAIHTELPAQADRRSTFTFALDAEASKHVANLENPTDQEDNDAASPAEDATLTKLFRSPVKQSSPPPVHYEQIVYPQLPHSDNEVENEVESIMIGEVSTVPVPSMEENACDSEVIETYPRTEDGTVLEEDAVDLEITQQNMGNLEPASPAPSIKQTPEAFADVAYPELPAGSSPDAACIEDTVEKFSLHSKTHATTEDSADLDVDGDLQMENDMEATELEGFTEVSLQLAIQRDYMQATHEEQPGLVEARVEDIRTDTRHKRNSYPDAAEVADLPDSVDKPHQHVSELATGDTQAEDITDGLSLSFPSAKAPSVEPTPRKLHSPPPPTIQTGFDDATMTIALDDDTALLKDFLNRAAASKAEKAAIITHRRESLQNRRDSDVIRHALQSPRKILEDKDPNSPSKYDNELTMDLSQTLTLSMDKNNLASPTCTATEEGSSNKSSRGSRRSSRTKTSRLPAPASAAQTQSQTSKIAIRRPDGTEHVVLKKSDAQELSLLTRANTRKNKQGAFGVTMRLMKLATDAANLPPLDESTREIIVGKNIRWDEPLTYYQENPETIADAESLATPDELGMPDIVSTPSAKPKSKVSKNSTPKIRRVRGLGTANGTPAKALLAPATFDEDDKKLPTAPTTTSMPAQQLPRPKTSKIRKMPVASAPTPTPDTKLPTLDIAPVGIEPTRQRKSRLTAPRKVTLPQQQQPSSLPLSFSLPPDGKENTQRSLMAAATPKKGIPAPKVVVPSSAVGVESALPRRRGRKV